MEYERLKCIQHHNMAMFGGFMGAYAVLTRCDVFANAQTMNLMSFVVALVGRSWKEVTLRFLALFAYVMSISICTILQNKNCGFVKMISLVLSTMAVGYSFLVPETMEPVLAVLPLFAVMPFQWCAFPGSYGYVSSTIFSSNNTKQATVSVVNYFMKKDRTQLRRAGFFLGSLICFYLGVALYAACLPLIGKYAILLGLVILIPAYAITILEGTGKE